MLVEPREPYRVKAGIFELYRSFDTNLGLFVRSFDMYKYFLRERLGQPLGICSAESGKGIMEL